MAEAGERTWGTNEGRSEFLHSLSRGLRDLPVEQQHSVLGDIEGQVTASQYGI